MKVAHLETPSLQRKHPELTTRVQGLGFRVVLLRTCHSWKHVHVTKSMYACHAVNREPKSQRDVLFLKDPGERDPFVF